MVSNEKDLQTMKKFLLIVLGVLGAHLAPATVVKITVEMADKSA